MNCDHRNIANMDHVAKSRTRNNRNTFSVSAEGGV